MIVWINGAFGAGKTTVSDELARRWPEAMTFDPEIVGGALGYWVPPSETGDFQDLPIWRDLVVQTALSIQRHYHRPLIVPMTLVVESYAAEIIGGLRDVGVQVHPFALQVSATTLRERIGAQSMDERPEHDERIRQWRLDQVDRCVAALGLSEEWVHVPNEGRDANATVDDIVARLPHPLPTSC